jgi:hypothetical protein
LLAATLLLAACAQLEGLDAEQRVPCLDDCPADAGPTGPTTDAPSGWTEAATGDSAAAVADSSSPPADSSAASDDAPLPAVDSAVGDAPWPADARSPSTEGGAEAGPTWTYRRSIALTSDAPAPLAGEPVLVIVPPTFDSTHAGANGDDLRFSTTPQHSDDLPYFVESWSPGAANYVWVRVPNVPVGSSTITMFYGNPAAAAASSFAATFPNAMRTAGGGAGSFVATGDIAVDWFELRAGDTVILPQGAPLHITARRVILAGIVGGNGRGFAGGSVPDHPGSGPGGGAVSNPVDTESSGGGGNAGTGGHGGEHTAGKGGAGGASAGTETGDDIAIGSGGGATNANAGGAGGGAVSVLGWRTTILDVVRADGLLNVGGASVNGGGGAGGGILVAGYSLELAGATLSAVGGSGGNCILSTGSGGGGGSGGRIKMKHRPNGQLTAPATTAVTGGAGGTCAGTTAAGVGGSEGTTYVDAQSMLVTGVESAVGNETSLE